MSDVPPASPAAGAGPSVSDEFRLLRRSRSDRVVAGVLGGLGRRLGIDPVVLRVATVVLAIFGGVGVLLYAIGWLVVPAEDEERSILDQALGRGEYRRSGTVPLALLLGGVGLIAGIGIIAGTWDGGVLLLLAVMGVYLLLRRRADDEQAGDGYPQEAGFDSYVYDPTVAPAAPGGTVTGPAGATAGPAATGPAAAATGAAAATAPAGPTGPTSGWPEGPDWGPPPEPPAPAPSPPPAKPAKQRSALGLITFCLALVSVGVLAANDASWADYPPAIYVAVPLGIVALGLIVGAWYGRSRGLIVLGFLLAIALVPATFVSQWDYHNSGNITRTYVTTEQIPTGTQEYGAGDITYDLSGLTLTDADTVRLDIEQGAGSLTITLPPNADVEITRASVGAGNLDIFGERQDGLGQELEDVTDNGADGPGGGTVVLDLELGLGDLEVTR
ncbi:PspC domain-containing protein [Jiangella sp. DSM 45060]|uniref:PspC domain-containing protein n=1 Tax=Jiangella sp. DSM 45060 TaxID=1798224 RepID=UPI00087B61CA|nr:PspC domain-containing protein [Jiangella sp. DSM 45060]SDS06238.1 Phage shock protein PspC (stress-responsive transcriptional regulator) [Jiangella sp. DSM 45060]